MNYLDKCMEFKREVLSFWKKNGVPHTKAMHDWKMEFILPKIAEMDISSVLEIGTCMGVSILTIAYAIRLMGRRPNCRSIDIKDRVQAKIFEGFPDYAQYVSLWVYKAGHTADFLETHAGISVDFLNLDGDHTQEGVKYDYDNFAPLVRPGGLITFDDVSTLGKFKGDKNPNAYVRSLGDVRFVPNYPKPGEIGQSGPDYFAYMHKEPCHATP